MDLVKLNGVLQKIVERYPNVDLVELLQDELHLSPSKAEALAQRIEKKYLQKTSEPKKGSRRVLEKPLEAVPSTESGYSIDCLSDVEFGHFMRWLLQELGYEVQLEKGTGGLGVDLVAEKDGISIAVIARKYPKNADVSDAVFVVSDIVRQTNSCKRSIVAVTTYFNAGAKEEAERLGVEVWDRDALADKIATVRRKAAVEAPRGFPTFAGSLLASLLRLEESKEFIVERRANGKFDLFLVGVKFPLLTFQADGETIVRCVFRMKNYEPTGEYVSEPLISLDENKNRSGPTDAEAYAAVTRYLKNFIQ